MNILYLAHRIPFPPNKGDKIRSFNEIKYLSEKHEIHLACLADDPKDLKYKEELKKYCKSVCVIPINPKRARLKSGFYLLSWKPLSVSYFYSSKLQGAIDHLVSTGDFGCVFCFSSQMAEYVFKSKSFASRLNDGLQHKTLNPEPAPRNPRPRLIMDFVDADSDKWAQYGKYVGFPQSWIYRIESRRLGRYERKIAESFDHSIFVTQAEVQVFRRQNPHIENVTAIQNGVDLDYFSPGYRLFLTRSDRPATSHEVPESSNRQPILVFTGAMDYYANIDGVTWFTKEVLPLIRKEIPKVKFFIVGSNPTQDVRELASGEGVVVTGYVKDTREYLQRATVVVVPLRIARGIQNKILEAMAMGLPVVATPQAFEGAEASPGEDLILEESVKGFARGTLDLIHRADLRKRLGASGRKTIERNYRWEKNLSGLEGILSA